MRIAIVGPGHPYKGGIAQSTTELAHRLTDAGHNVTLLSWKAQYPKLLYPGNQYVAQDKPEVPTFSNTQRKLNWKNPTGWWRQVSKLRGYDQIIFVWWVPTIQGPPYITMLKALGKKGPKTIVICHNVLPHEPKPGDTFLTKRVLSAVDLVVVHSKNQATIAQKLTSTEIKIAGMPPVLPKPQLRESYKLQHHLLFFGIVREYKGLDILLKALSTVPGVKLIVVGEFWKATMYDKLISELGIGPRVELHKGYVAHEDLASVFAKADALVLPYRGGTATFNVAMAHNFSLPVIATTASTLAKQVNDGVDGLLCPPNDVDALAKTIRKFYEPGVAQQLQSHIPKATADDDWQNYVKTIIN